MWPDKFTNVTNGVTQRRWLAFCNEPLRRLISKRLGSDAWIKCAPILSLMNDIAYVFLAVLGSCYYCFHPPGL